VSVDEGGEDLRGRIGGSAVTGVEVVEQAEIGVHSGDGSD
jgi:hypothetical protein